MRASGRGMPRERPPARTRSRSSSARRSPRPPSSTVTWSGTTATLRWKATAADSLEDTPTGYVLEAGSNPGLSDVGAVNVGNVTSVSAEVSAGTYYVRVRSVNDLGTSHVTTDIALIAPGAPAAPAALVETSAAGEGTVRLRWTAPGGAAPLGYLVEAGSEPGLSDLAKLQVASRHRVVDPRASGNLLRARARGERARRRPGLERDPRPALKPGGQGSAVNAEP